MSEADGRTAAILGAAKALENGSFLQTLAARIAIPSESQNPDAHAALHAYLAQGMVPALAGMGFDTGIYPNPVPDAGPILIGKRIEDPALPTVLIYGHGDTVRGQEEQWRDGLHPWRLVREGERLYGRGTADNKGQHSINLAGLEAVLAERGRLGFNVKVLIETGEEIGSRGLREFCRAERDALSADVLIASDGPRLQPGRPTIFLGSRGTMNFELKIALREGGQHSGNWGGLLANPAILLSHALATIVDRRGKILVPALLPPPIPNAVRAAIAGCVMDGGPDAPQIDPDWGEPALTPWERVFGWNTFEILACEAGNPARPVNAIPPMARAVCQMRFVAGCDADSFIPAIRKHLEEQGFGMVEVTPLRDPMMATRTDPDDPWVRWASRSIERTMGAAPAILPNLGGSLPNDVFTEILGLPTVWVPHSYSACSQHAPNEHLLLPIVEEGLRIMAGLFWDLGEGEVRELPRASSAGARIAP